MYDLEVREKVDNQFRKLFKKDKVSFQHINKKILEIRTNPYHFKPLRGPMKNYWRVHIGNFVLVYSIDEPNKKVIIERYEHHNVAYKN